MTTFIHVVGGQGVGKSMLILALAAQYQARGLVCAGQDPEVFTSRSEALESAPGADVCFVEHLCEQGLDALPGELVIAMARVAAVGGFALPMWDQRPRLGDWIGKAADVAQLHKGYLLVVGLTQVAQVGGHA